MIRKFAMLATVLLAGCATFPTDSESRAAESTWLALDAIDTAQTAQLVRHPKCFYEADPMARAVYGNRNPSSKTVIAVNLLLMPVHARVSRWFDDHADQAYADDSDSATLWAFGRLAWHTVSIVATGASVANNALRGISPTSARCDR